MTAGVKLGAANYVVLKGRQHSGLTREGMGNRLLCGSGRATVKIILWDLRTPMQPPLAAGPFELLRVDSPLPLRKQCRAAPVGLLEI